MQFCGRGGSGADRDHCADGCLLSGLEHAASDARGHAGTCQVALQAEPGLCLPDDVRAATRHVLHPAGGRYPGEAAVRHNYEDDCSRADSQQEAVVCPRLLSARLYRYALIHLQSFMMTL